MSKILNDVIDASGGEITFEVNDIDTLMDIEQDNTFIRVNPSEAIDLAAVLLKFATKNFVFDGVTENPTSGMPGDAEVPHPRSIEARIDSGEFIDPNDVMVQSETAPGAFYHLDLEERTCTCPSFEHAEGHHESGLCKHLRKILTPGIDF